jgi:ubiquinone/menaquinone biosynthesis C-methylase UbiE
MERPHRAPGSLAFDRVAHLYDETRGGEERGRSFAEQLHGVLDAPALTLEVGVGTAIVAKALIDLGHRVVGVDLSEPMARRARQRIGPRVARGDATRLPIRDASVPQAYSVWVMHVVGDQAGMLREVARALAPNGRFVVLPALGLRPTNALGALVWDMSRRLDPQGLRRDDPDRLAELAPAAGFRVVEIRQLPTAAYDETPAQVLRKLEGGTYSSQWDITDEQWANEVVPTIEAVRALPDHDGPEQQYARNSMVIMERKK